METIEIMPENDYSGFDINGYPMAYTQTTGLLALNAGIPVKSLVHSVKTANGMTVGIVEKTFLPGDYVPLSVRIEVQAELAEPVLAVGLIGDNTEFCLTVIEKSAGVADEKAVAVFKNGAILPAGNIVIYVRNDARTLAIKVNETFIAGDILEIIYYTKLCVNEEILRAGHVPDYGSLAHYGCYIEWGDPVMVYSAESQSAGSTDILEAELIVSSPGKLQ